MAESVSAPTQPAPADGPTDAARREAQLFDRILLRIIPFLVLCYCVAYLSRVNLSFAALQMNRDLGLTATSYGLGAGLFFITYCLCEVPSNLLMHRFGASRWIARIMFTWGICAMAMAFIRGPGEFFLVRLLLGAAEAGFYPGVLYLLSIWFPARYRARAMSMFIVGLPISGVIGGPLSGALLSLEGWHGLHGWQWLFLIEGAPALLLAPLVLRFVQDGPESARWLTADDRMHITRSIEAEHGKVEARRPYALMQVLANPWVLLLAITYFTNVCLLNGTTFFLPQIVKGFGVSNLVTGLIVALPNIAAIPMMIWWGRRSDSRQERYGHAALANFIGATALLLAMIVHDPVVKIVAITLSFACTLAFPATFWAIPGSFLTGAAAAAGIAAISALGVVGGFIAPFWIGFIKDHTGDVRAGLGSLACMAMVFSVLFYVVGRRRGPGSGMAAAVRR